MTSRDFTILAAAFRRTYDGLISDAAKSAVTQAVVTVADALEQDNPRFKRLTFYDAANVPPRSNAYKRAVKQARVHGLNDLSSDD